MTKFGRPVLKSLAVSIVPVLLLAACAKSPEELAREEGRRYYRTVCATCHLEDGRGMSAPLVNSKWVTGPEETLVRIILQGKKGTADMDMPPHLHLTDEQIASILTYLRTEWGHEAPPIEAARVARIRKATSGRNEAWTERELLQLPGGVTPGAKNRP